jgi:hypothetical protein
MEQCIQASIEEEEEEEEEEEANVFSSTRQKGRESFIRLSRLKTCLKLDRNWNIHPGLIRWMERLSGKDKEVG